MGGVPEGFNLGVLVGFLEGGREEGRGRVLCSLFQPGIWELCTGGIESGCGESRLQSRDCESRPQSQGLREFRGGEVRPLPARGCLGAWPGAGGRASGGEILGLYVWSCIIWALGVFPQLFQELRALEIYLLPDCEISPSAGTPRSCAGHRKSLVGSATNVAPRPLPRQVTALNSPPPSPPDTPPYPPPQLCPSSAKALFQASQVSPPIDTPPRTTANPPPGSTAAAAASSKRSKPAKPADSSDDYSSDADSGDEGQTGGQPAYSLSLPPCSPPALLTRAKRPP